MEHSTNTSYGYSLINGGHTYDYVIAHELAHQWWGDSLSPRDLAGHLAQRGLRHATARRCGSSTSAGRGLPQLHAARCGASTLQRPGLRQPELFGTTVYDKGAWVQHMLRGVLGDAAFFQRLRDWYATHKDGVVNTAQYQAPHGGDLRRAARLVLRRVGLRT